MVTLLQSDFAALSDPSRFSVLRDVCDVQPDSTVDHGGVPGSTVPAISDEFLIYLWPQK